MSTASPSPVRSVVHFDDADGEGIVFFGNYFRLAHRALEAYLPQLNIPWAEWFQHAEWGVPLRHVEADYRQPLRPGDTFDVNISVLHLGESSVQFGYEFLALDGTLYATLKTSHVFVSRPMMKKINIPENIRTRLASAI